MAPSDVPSVLSAEAIRGAHHAVPTEFRDSPQFVSDGLSDRAGAPILVKVECVNPIRSFKGRGTSLALAAMVRSRGFKGSRGVATISTGNFGQGVAYAARATGVAATVVVPRGANPSKLAVIRRLGASIREVAPGDDADAHLRELEQAGWVLLRDGHDDRIAIGAGTMALEVTDGIGGAGLPPIEAAFVPVGDGSLIAGVATWLRAHAPGARVVGVQVQSAPAMALSWRTGRVEVVPPEPSRADGLASGSGNADLLPTLRKVVDDFVLVPEDGLLEAQRELHALLGVTAEASAAASWSAAASASGEGGARLVIVTGSNHWPGDFDSSARGAAAGAEGAEAAGSAAEGAEGAEGAEEGAEAPAEPGAE
jgi:threonine dehydratase